MPKFIYLLHSTKEADADEPPTTELLTEMMAYNTSLSEAGLLLSAEGFQSSKHGRRIKFSGSITVQSGPFDMPGLICGFWLVKAKSLDEAVEWAKKAPLKDTTLEVRQIGQDEDFGDALTDELKHKEAYLRTKMEDNAKAA